MRKSIFSVNSLLVKNEDWRQALRMGRFLMAALSFVVTFLMAYVLHLQGLMEQSTVVYGMTFSACGLAVFYLIFRQGWNKKAKDPSLTGPMMITAAAVIFWMMLDSPTARATMGTYLCVIMLFGVFRFSTRTLLQIALGFILTYAAMLAFLYLNGKTTAELALDMGRLIVMICVLPLIAWVGGQITSLRSRLNERKKFFQTIWDTCNDAVVVIDRAGCIRYTNPAIQAVLGFTPAEAVGLHVGALESDRSEGIISLAAAAHAMQDLEQKTSWETEGVRHDGSRVPLEVTLGKTHLRGEDLVVAFLSDITMRKTAEQQIRHLAQHDPLTGLPNRMTLNDRLRVAIASAERNRTGLWVLFLDFDRFKLINDSLGHRCGDVVLTTMAARLTEACRDSDTVARLGGDEFVMVFSDTPDSMLSAHVVERLMTALSAPIHVDEHEVTLTPSIGIAVYPEDGATPESLVEHADIAMYRAKQEGRNGFRFYTPSMNDIAIARLQMEGDIRAALERSEFVLHYQPQADLESGEIVGVEALLRWDHPEKGIIGPGDFITIAEETGLIVPIGEWVIRRACEQQRAWEVAGMRPLRVSINVSPKQFAQKGLVGTIAAILRDTGASPGNIEFEITEGMLINDIDHAVTQLEELKALGVHLSIDDFGTGYSSLAYLRKLPIDVLKIDRSFIGNLPSDDNAAAIVMAIISMARTLNMQIVAEGVELQEQLQYLQQAGCDRMQGYFLSRPLAPHIFESTMGQGLLLPGTGSNATAP